MREWSHSRHRFSRPSVLGVLLISALLGCSDKPPELPGLSTTCPGMADREVYVINQVTIPRTASDVVADSFAFVPGAPAQEFNGLGSSLQMFQSMKDLDSPIQAHLGSGIVGWALVVHECSDGSALAWSTSVGISNGSALLPTNMGVASVGQIMGDSITTDEGYGYFPLSLFFDPDPTTSVGWASGLSLDLKATLSADRSTISGTIGLGIESNEAYNALVPAFARLLSALAVGCPSSCPSTFATQIEATFDRDGDGRITDEEFRSGSQIWILPDADLTSSWNGQVVYWPGHDGMVDHVTLGISFSASRVML